MPRSYRELLAITIPAVVLLIYGCAAVSIVSIPVTAINVGSMAYQALETADISIAIDPEADIEEWNSIRRIALWMGRENAARPCGRIGDLGAVVADNLVVELMSHGYSVYGPDRIPIAPSDEKDKVESERQRLIAAVRDLDVQVIVTGSVSASHINSMGFAGTVRTSTVVQSLSLQMTEAAGGRTMMILTIDYHTGQSPQVAAKGAAIILKAKMDDPRADVKRLFSFRRDGASG
ncbi:MAG: hypothetical protein PHU03_03905 [Syntrophales bacterium]|nr:hypothetical protein [Syntrophales bacterium]